MSEKKYRLVGGYWVDSGMSIYVKVGAGAWYQQTLATRFADAFAYVSGDTGGDDIVTRLQKLINDDALPAMTATGTITITLNNTTGIVSIAWDDSGGGGALQLKFEHPTTPLTNPNCYFLHNALRLTTTQASTITIAGGGAGTVTGTRCHGYGLYPLRYLMSDLSEYQARVSQAVPDQGQVQTLRSAMLELYRLGIRTDIAYPRAALFNEYHALVDFLDNAASGRPFRVYPDKTVYAAYADASNPYGYRTWVLDKDSASWRPEPAVNNFYKVLDVDLKCWQWVE
jgi:hypothetical protein